MLIHAFDPTSFMTCHNLAIRPFITSPNCVASFDPGIQEIHVRVEDLNIDDIREGQFRSAVTPRAVTYMHGLMLSRGMRITDGYGSQLGCSEEERRRLINIYETEFVMENVRRSIAPTAPSRLGCIWVAEESPQSRAMLLEMFPSSRHVVSVEVAERLSIFRADASFYDQLFQTGDPQAAEQYWLGTEFRGNWEILLDGAIWVVNAVELETLLQDCRAMGNRLPGRA